MTFRTWRRGTLCQRCILGLISPHPQNPVEELLTLQDVQIGVDLVASTQAYSKILYRMQVNLIDILFSFAGLGHNILKFIGMWVIWIFSSRNEY